MQRRLEQAIDNYQKLVPEQELVTVNSDGLFLNLGFGLNLGYSMKHFQIQPHEYLQSQLEQHKRYKGSLEIMRGEAARDANSYKIERGLFGRLFEPIKKKILEGSIDEKIEEAERDYAKARVLREAAAYCHFFHQKLFDEGENGLLGIYYQETFAGYDIDKLKEYNNQITEALGDIIKLCEDLKEKENEKRNNLQLRRRLES